MSRESNAALGEQFFKSQDQSKGAPDPALCDASYMATIGGFPTMGYAGHSAFAGAFYGAFPDLSHTINSVVADDDKVAVHFTMRGTGKGSFMGTTVTDKSVVVGAMAVMAVKDGKVTQLTAIFDQLGLMQQIGALPGA